MVIDNDTLQILLTFVTTILTVSMPVLLIWMNAKLKRMEKVTDSTHTLVNSNMTVQLRLNAALAHRVATESGKESDMRVAEQADATLHEHMLQQGKADDQAEGRSSITSLTPKGELAVKAATASVQAAVKTEAAVKKIAKKA